MAPAIIQTLPRSHTSCWSFMTGRADEVTISARSVTVLLKPNLIRVAYVCYHRSPAKFLLRKPGFDPRSVYVRFVVDKMALV
jgi:hypothetical protein